MKEQLAIAGLSPAPNKGYFMQKHDAKNASGSSGTQQPGKKVDSNLDHKKQSQKQGDRINKSDDGFNSPQRNK